MHHSNYVWMLMDNSALSSPSHGEQTSNKTKQQGFDPHFAGETRTLNPGVKLYLEW